MARKRKPVQLPNLNVLWGLQLVGGSYRKLVVTVRCSDAEEATRALETFGSCMTFIGEIDPPLISSLDLLGRGMNGRRNFSRIPLADLESFRSVLDSTHFNASGGQVWNMEALEVIFGKCPARSASDAFTKKAIVLNLHGAAFPPIVHPTTQNMFLPAGGVRIQNDVGDALNCEKPVLPIPACDDDDGLTYKKSTLSLSRMGNIFQSLKDMISGNDTQGALEELTRLQSMISAAWLDKTTMGDG